MLKRHIPAFPVQALPQRHNPTKRQLSAARIRRVAEIRQELEALKKELARVLGLAQEK